MAWFLVAQAFSVYLTVGFEEAAERVFRRDPSSMEEYRSMDEARAGVLAREQSERTRFSRLYGVDITRFSNYDLVVDTTSASPDEVCAVIIESLESRHGRRQSSTHLYLDPRRVLPTDNLRRVGRDAEQPIPVEWRGRRRPPIDVCVADGLFAVVDGHVRLSRSLMHGDPLVEARVAGQDEDEVLAGLTARGYLAGEVTRANVYDWEAAHGFRFSAYPTSFDARSPAMAGDDVAAAD
jgi:hypothetical protein